MAVVLRPQQKPTNIVKNVSISNNFSRLENLLRPPVQVQVHPQVVHQVVHPHPVVVRLLHQQPSPKVLCPNAEAESHCPLHQGKSHHQIQVQLKILMLDLEPLLLLVDILMENQGMKLKI